VGVQVAQVSADHALEHFYDKINGLGWNPAFSVGKRKLFCSSLIQALYGDMALGSLPSRLMAPGSYDTQIAGYAF
jgi:hypothetical protein